MWVIVKKYEINLKKTIMLQNIKHLIIAKVRKIWNKNLKFFWKIQIICKSETSETNIFTMINSFTVEHSENIWNNNHTSLL